MLFDIKIAMVDARAAEVWHWQHGIHPPRPAFRHHHHHRRHSLRRSGWHIDERCDHALQKGVLFSMTEKNHDAASAAPPASAGTGTGAGATAPGLPPTNRRLLWAVASLAAVLAILIVTWLVRAVGTEKAMFEVAKSVGPQLASPAPQPLPDTPAAAPATPTATPPGSPGMRTDTGDAREGDAVAESAQQMDGTAPIAVSPEGQREADRPQSGTTDSRDLGTASKAPKLPPAPGRVAATQRAGTGEGTPAPQRSAPAEQAHRQRSANAATRPAAPEDRLARETFRRCPALGDEGAVLCRWHICNGAAGKEAACRPYLERRR
ncbi:hypothetical protein IP91_00304 [Pseudoduganella lurida]|uniref:Uncharacterized protein n=1 Tax=Pseudoduganella lurida TaxID=1036180 RepID=A0A562RJL6_9BURK|nr:hypothetical protein [Pseudoduganella lurida]TWI69238.1 hypothetical protein IP91_00304 [Pseudoduganella lurida]